jgi:hypothetical protein
VTDSFGRGALVAVAIGLGLLLLAAPKADGAFPGRNGNVAVYDGKALVFVSPDGSGAEVARDRRGRPLLDPSGSTVGLDNPGFSFEPGGKRIAYGCFHLARPSGWGSAPSTRTAPTVESSSRPHP